MSESVSKAVPAAQTVPALVPLKEILDELGGQFPTLTYRREEDSPTARGGKVTTLIIKRDGVEIGNAWQEVYYAGKVKTTTKWHVSIKGMQDGVLPPNFSKYRVLARVRERLTQS